MGRREVITAIAGTVGAFWIAYLILRRKKKAFPTYPGGNFITGHFSELMKDYGQNFGAHAQHLSRVTNSPAGYYKLFFGRKVLTITSYDLAKEVFVLNGSISSGREIVLIRQIHMLNKIDNAVATIDGQNWKNNRIVFNNQLRAFGKESLFQIIQTEAGFLTDALEAASRDGPVEPSELLQKAVSNITCTLLFGSRYNYQDEEFTRALDSLMKYNNSFKPAPHSLLLINKYVKTIPFIREKEKHMNAVKEFCRHRVEERLGAIRSSTVKDSVMVDGYLEEAVKGSKDSSKVVQDVATIIFELFFAGTETTSTTLLWALQYLVAYPDIRGRIQKEIDSVIDRDTPVLESALGSFPYFQATQMEVQRFACIALGTLRHRMTQDLVVSTGETIAKNEAVTGAIYCINRDPRHWKYPDEFNPGNFLNEDGAFVRNEAFFAYGQGPRVCLGEKIADLELKLFLLSILQRLDISCSEEVDISVRVPGITSSPKKYAYSFTKRF